MIPWTVEMGVIPMRSLILAPAAALIGLMLSMPGASAKTVKECNAEYADNKPAIQNSGQKKKDFVTACRAGTETIPSAAAAPAPPPAPAAPAPAPIPPPPTPTVAPAPPPPPPPIQTVRPRPPIAAPTRTTTSGVEFQTEAEAQGRCPGAVVVWVNTKSGVYHFKGTHNYGNTKEGDYMCESDAASAGDRAAKNEKHP